MPFRDDLHAARIHAARLEETNQRLTRELEATYVGRFPRRSVRHSIAVMLVSLLALITLGVLAGFGTLIPRPQVEPDWPAVVARASDAVMPAIGPGAASSAEPPDALVVEDVRLGLGPIARAGDKLAVHYVGSFPTGEEFENSRKRGQPFKFTLGKGRVIKGWDDGLQGMHVGGERRLSIPARLAYAERGSPPTIPPNTALVFDVELLTIE